MYTVIWRTAAEDEFKRLWNQTDDPGLILNSARRLEAKLQRDPANAGESRAADDFYIAFEFPLGINFWLSELDKLVYIVRIWRID
jgi:hypothetical protein